MTVTLHYTREILRSAILAYLRGIYWKSLAWPTVLTAALIVYGAYGAPPWLQGLILVPAILLPASLGLGYAMRMRQSLRTLDLLEDGNVEVRLEEDGLRVVSAMGDSLLKWDLFEELRDTPRAFLLVYLKSQFITLPKSQIPEDFLIALRGRLNRAGSG